MFQSKIFKGFLKHWLHYMDWATKKLMKKHQLLEIVAIQRCPNQSFSWVSETLMDWSTENAHNTTIFKSYNFTISQFYNIELQGPCESTCPGVEIGMYSGFGVFRATNKGGCNHDFFRCCKVREIHLKCVIIVVKILNCLLEKNVLRCGKYF